MKTHGHEFKLDVGVIYDVEDDFPIVGKVQDIYIIDGCKVLFNVNLHWTHYQPHFRAYMLSRRADVQEKFLNLFIETPVYIRRSQVLETETFIFIGVARGGQGRAFARPSLIFALLLISCQTK